MDIAISGDREDHGYFEGVELIRIAAPPVPPGGSFIFRRNLTAFGVLRDILPTNRAGMLAALVMLAVGPFLSGGCSTIRVTDPEQTADQEFLESEATRLAIQPLIADQLRDRKVFVDGTFLTTVRENSDSLSFRQTPQPYLFLLGELRAKLLLAGARLMERREEAEIIVEPRTGGISVDHQEFLLGLSSLTIPTEVVADVPFQTPELAILKSTKQYGFASVAFVAYWRDTGELVASSGPFVGRTSREDYWIFGMGPRTVGNIPPAQKPPPSALQSSP